MFTETILLLYLQRISLQGERYNRFIASYIYLKGQAIIQLLRNEMYTLQSYRRFRSTVQCATSVAGLIRFSIS